MLLIVYAAADDACCVTVLAEYMMQLHMAVVVFLAVYTDTYLDANSMLGAQAGA